MDTSPPSASPSADSTAALHEPPSPTCRNPRTTPLPSRFRPRPRPIIRVRNGLGLARGFVRVGEADSTSWSPTPGCYDRPITPGRRDLTC